MEKLAQSMSRCERLPGRAGERGSSRHCAGREWETVTSSSGVRVVGTGGARGPGEASWELAKWVVHGNGVSDSFLTCVPFPLLPDRP